MLLRTKLFLWAWVCSVGSVMAGPASVAQGRIDMGFAEGVFAEICNSGIEEPQVVMRQVILETGWLRSPFLMAKNNLFAFRKVLYLEFEHWTESVQYYKSWQDRHYRDSDKSYFSFLQRIKYGSRDYLTHLKKIKWDRECPAEAQ